MSHPDGLPDLFLDRSLGRVKVPALLRASGLRLVTLAEHYGIPFDQTVADTEWLQLAGRRDWAVFMKDSKIRHNPVERDTVRELSVRCFCISNQNLSGGLMAARLLDNLPAIARACESSGPFIYAVHRTRSG